MSILKKRTALPIIILLLTTLQAYSAEDRIVRIATFDAKPMAYMDIGGEIKGIFPDILKAIFHNTEYKTELIHHKNFLEAYSSIRNGKSDIICCLIKTADREKSLTYNSEPFLNIWSTVDLPAGSSVKSILDLKNRKIGIVRGDQNGRNFIKLMKSFRFDFHPKYYDSFSDISNALARKNIDAGVYFNSYHFSNKKVKPSGIVFSPTEVYIAAKKGNRGNEKILSFLDRKLLKMKKDKSSHYYSAIKKINHSQKDYAMPIWLNVTIIALIVLINGSIILIIIFRHMIQRTKNELMESQLNYKTVADNTFNWELWHDSDNNIKYCSPACEPITGYSPDDFIDKPELFREIITDDTKEIWDRHFFHSELTGDNAHDIPVTFCINTKSGEKKWIEHYCKTVFSNGKNLGVRSSNSDITKRAQAYDDLRQSNARYRSLFYESGSVMLLIDPNNGNILDANRAAVDYYGYTQQRLKNMKISQINTLPEEEVKKRMTDAVKSRTRFFQFQHRLANGEIRDVQIHAGYVKFGEKQLLYTILHDNTESIKIQAELENSENLYRTVFNSNLDGILIYSPESKIKFVNPAICTITGYTGEELLKKSPAELISPDSYNKFIESQKSVENGEEIRTQIVARKKSGEIFYAQVYSRIIKYRGRRVHFCLIHDITERKNFEENLIREKERAEESDKLKTAFLANMSHELRTPLNGIMGMHNLLKETELDDEQKRMLNMASIAAENLFSIIRDLLDLSRIDTNKLKLHYTEFDACKQFDILINLFRKKAALRNITLNFNNEEDSILWVGDKSRISQIVMNLLSNAIKFSDGGEVTLSLEFSRDMIIKVSDQGVGISPEKIDEIFRPFHQLENPYTKKHQGIGAGLAIVKNIIELMAGSIDVESEPGKGTTFIVKIPPGIKSSAKLSEHIVSENNRRINLKKVMIVEDDEISRLFIKRILTKEGYGICEASDGEEAASVAESELPDIILMDIGLPKKNGLDVIAELKEKSEFRDTPIIAVTAHAHRDDKERVMNAGADEVITKPYGREYILERLREYSINKK